MFRDNKNLKDSGSDSEDITLKDITSPISYTKTSKLITALYMVTDIIDRDEPLRNKLRTLGSQILSDVYLNPSDALVSISQVMSFLDLSSAVNIISEMNAGILRKEFSALGHSIEKAYAADTHIKGPTQPVNLEEFFRDPGHGGAELSTQNYYVLPARVPDIGHHSPTRIGVQKGSTLMRAIKDMSNRVPVSDRHAHPASTGNHGNHRAITAENFVLLKKQRQEDIVNIIKIIGGNATIKDIKDRVKAMPARPGDKGSFLSSCSEKTLQRELVSMVHSGVLNKTGEKRWSRYFLK